jgi:hypothetical protein
MHLFTSNCGAQLQTHLLGYLQLDADAKIIDAALAFPPQKPL